MRAILAIPLLLLCACASEKLAQSPPAGVDFTGRWKLNEADSDSPQRLAQSQLDSATRGAGTGGASSGRGGRQGGRGGASPLPYSAPLGPMMPSMSVLADALHWPGKQLELKQVAGVVAFSSEGYNRVCQPTDGTRPRRHHDDRDRGDRRDAPARGRDIPPPRCGWSDKTLIVQGGELDDDQPPFEEHYSLSDDGQRLVETVNFRGGRSSGFSMSRVWDRAE